MGLVPSDALVSGSITLHRAVSLTAGIALGWLIGPMSESTIALM